MLIIMYKNSYKWQHNLRIIQWTKHVQSGNYFHNNFNKIFMAERLKNINIINPIQFQGMNMEKNA